MGPNHILETVNGAFAIFDKQGRVLRVPASARDVWQGFSGVCATDDSGDPVAMYDHLADRWVMMQMSRQVVAGSGHQCVAVSRSGDPLGTWARYEFPFPGPPDYGKIGLWRDTYLFSTSGTDPYQSYVCALDRAAMLEGSAATQQCFAAPANEPQPFPVDVDGEKLPPLGVDPWFISSPVHGDLGIFRLHVDWRNPSASALSARLSLPVADWNPALDALAVTQRGTSQGLTAGTGILRHRLAYRNFGDHEAIVTGHTVDAGGGIIGLRWYEIRPDGSGALHLFQQGTFAPDATHRHVPSMAMDRVGNLAIGYSASSSSVYPSIRYAGRLASDPLGELTLGEGSLFEGQYSQTWSYSWGDYSSLQIDPVDDCTFWFTAEYAGQSQSGTQVSAFRLPGCAASVLPDGGMSDAGPPDAGALDAGPADAGPADAGASDAGTFDAGPADAGAYDAGPADAGGDDAGAADGGAPGADRDAGGVAPSPTGGKGPGFTSGGCTSAGGPLTALVVAAWTLRRGCSRRRRS